MCQEVEFEDDSHTRTFVVAKAILLVKLGLESIALLMVYYALCLNITICLTKLVFFSGNSSFSHSFCFKTKYLI